MPDPIDPIEGGAGDPGVKTGGAEDMAAMVAGVVTKQITDLEGRMSKMITGAVGRQVQDVFKSEDYTTGLSSMLKTAVSELEEAKNAKAPTPTQALTQQVQSLGEVIQTERQLRIAAEDASKAQKLQLGIQGIVNGLDGKDGRPALSEEMRQPFLNLIASGYDLGGQPMLDEAGNIVAQAKDGTTRPLSEILTNGYFGAEHWALKRFAATGSGAGAGAGGKAGPASGGAAVTTEAELVKKYREGGRAGQAEVLRYFAGDDDAKLAFLTGPARTRPPGVE